MGAGSGIGWRGRASWRARGEAESEQGENDGCQWSEWNGGQQKGCGLVSRMCAGAFSTREIGCCPFEDVSLLLVVLPV
jgi:hypothetical protein